MLCSYERSLRVGATIHREGKLKVIWAVRTVQPVSRLGANAPVCSSLFLDMLPSRVETLLSMTLVPGPVAASVSFTLDAGGSTLSADITVNTAAVHTIQVFVNAAAVTGGGPSTLPVFPAAVAPDESYAIGPGLSTAIAGTPTTVTVTPLDAFGNLVVTPSVLCQGVLTRTERSSVAGFEVDVDVKAAADCAPSSGCYIGGRNTQVIKTFPTYSVTSAPSNGDPCPPTLSTVPLHTCKTSRLSRPLSTAWVFAHTSSATPRRLREFRTGSGCC